MKTSHQTWLERCALAALAMAQLLGAGEASAKKRRPETMQVAEKPPDAPVRYQAFATRDALVAADTNGLSDVYLKDLDTGAVELVSVAQDGSPLDRPSSEASVSGDGRFVAFTTAAALVPEDQNGLKDVYLRDRQEKRTVLVSRNYLARAANAPSSQPVVAWEGEYVAFVSSASDLVRDDTNYTNDVFIYSRRTGIPRRISVGQNGAQLDEPSFLPSISPAGVYVGFRSLSRLFDEQSHRDVHYYVVELPGIGNAAHRAIWLVDPETMEVIRKEEPAAATAVEP